MFSKDDEGTEAKGLWAGGTMTAGEVSKGRPKVMGLTYIWLEQTHPCPPLLMTLPHLASPTQNPP